MTAANRGCICVFAKPPRAGHVKTRLAKAIGDARAARLAGAFLVDTWQTVLQVDWADPVLATTDADASECADITAARVWSQGQGTLGDRMERVARRALATYPFVILIGSDLPGLPMQRLESAREALKRSRAVLGPADDGGFYLIGLRACDEGLLADLPWSAPSTFARTLSRMDAAGMNTVVIDPWCDIDEMGDLERLIRRVRSGDIKAPATSRVLQAEFPSPAGVYEVV